MLEALPVRVDWTMHAQKRQKTVGVLGGLGPEATLDFFHKVLEKTQAKTDQEGLHLIIDNNPAVPNRNEAVAKTGPSPAPHLAGMAKGLERAGADFLVMVCNAAHAFEEAITDAVSIPFVSLIEETVGATLRDVPDIKRVGVLGSSGCLEAGLYQHAFAPHGVQVLVPEGEARDRFMTLLYRIKGGDKGDEVREGMRALAEGLVERGAEAIIAGCTEVPLVLLGGDVRVPLVNSTDVLVDATVAYATGTRSLTEGVNT